MNQIVNAQKNQIQEKVNDGNNYCCEEHSYKARNENSFCRNSDPIANVQSFLE